MPHHVCGDYEVIDDAHVVREAFMKTEPEPHA